MGTAASAHPSLDRMAPHQPGIADGKEDQRTHACDHLRQRQMITHQVDQRKQETDQPEMLVEPPEMEREAALCKNRICLWPSA
jgi:hypothetical protein